MSNKPPAISSLVRIALILAVGCTAYGKPYERRYKYYLDVANAEQIIAGIALGRPLYDDQWLKIIGDRRDETYKVKAGDTLWSIAGRQFGNSHLWRKLWEVNPFLTNPHELEVGQLLRYYNEATPNRAPASLHIPIVKIVPDKGGGTDLDSDSLVNREVKNRYRPALLIVKDSDVLGVLTGGYSEKSTFTDLDDIYAEFFGNRPKVGDRFTVIRYERKLRDRTKVFRPVIGILVRQVGEAVVVENGAKLDKLELKTMFAKVSRGDRLIALSKPVNWSTLIDPPDGLNARIVAGDEAGHHFFNRGSVVLLNKGAQDGVREGFVFRVYRDFDPHTHRHADVEPDFKGEIQVIYVADQSSVGYILKNQDSIGVGDRVVPIQAFPNRPPPPQRPTQTIDLD